MAVEHAMFTFGDLKVNPRDDRQTDRQTDRQNERKNMAAIQEILTSIGYTAVK